MKKLLLLILLMASSAQAERLVCMGDSVAEGVPHVKSGESYCTLLGGINAGHGGDTSYQGLERFKKDVLAQNPDTITIAFGLNDASNFVTMKKFKEYMYGMIRLSHGKKIILLTPPPKTL